MAEFVSGQRGRLRSFASLLLAIVFAIGPAAPADARRRKKDEAKVEYTVSQAVAKKLTPALEALASGDNEEAHRLLTAVEKRGDRNSPYERALVYQMFGFLYGDRISVKIQGHRASIPSVSGAKDISKSCLALIPSSP